MPVKTLESASHRTFLSNPSQASLLELFERTNSSSCVSPKSCKQEPLHAQAPYCSIFSINFISLLLHFRNTIRKSLGSLLTESKIPVHFTVASHDAKPSHKTWRIAYQRRDNTMRRASTMLFRHQRSGHIHGVWKNQSWFRWYGHHSL